MDTQQPDEREQDSPREPSPENSPADDGSRAGDITELLALTTALTHSVSHLSRQVDSLSHKLDRLTVPPAAPAPAAPFLVPQQMPFPPNLAQANMRPRPPLHAPPNTPPPVPASPSRPVAAPLHPPTGHAEARPPARRATGSGESALGKYLLSGAAALLVFLSGATLTAMLWDSIPNIVKVGVVGVLGVCLTALGAFMSSRATTTRLPSATVMGTGGGLVFLSLVGASLLRVLSPFVAFLLLTVWAALLIVLAARTRLIFTTAIAALGGITTIVLASQHAASHPDDAFIAMIMMVAHSVALSVTTTLTALKISPPSLRPVYHLVAATVTLTTLLTAPLRFAYGLAPIGALALNAAIPALLYVNAFLISRSSITPSETTNEACPNASDPVLTIIHSLRENPWLHAWVFTPVAIAVHASRTESNILTGFNDLTHTVILLGVLTFALTIHTCLAFWPARSGVNDRSVTATIWASHSLSATICFTAYATVHSPEQTIIINILALVLLIVSALVILRTKHAGHAWTLPFYCMLIGWQTLEAYGSAIFFILLIVATALIVFTDKYCGESEWAEYRILPFISLFLFLFPLFIGSFFDLPTVSNDWVFGVVAATFMTFMMAFMVLGLGAGPVRPWLFVLGTRFGARPTLRQSSPSHRALPSSWASTLLITLSLILFTVIPLIKGFLISRANPNTQDSDAPSIFIGAFLLAFAVTLVWLHALLMRSLFFSLGTALVVTLLLLTAITLIFRTGYSSMPASITLLATGAAAIVLGFRWKTTPTRLYGLGLVMLVVLKFAFWDLGAENNLVRVIALLVGGLICFGLSIIYARVDAQLSKRPTSPTDHPDKPSV